MEGSACWNCGQYTFDQLVRCKRCGVLWDEKAGRAELSLAGEKAAIDLGLGQQEAKDVNALLSDYATGRSIATFVAVLGIAALVVAVGGVLATINIWEHDQFVGIYALTTSAMTAMGGALLIGASQMMKATFDTANNTTQILAVLNERLRS